MCSVYHDNVKYYYGYVVLFSVLSYSIFQQHHLNHHEGENAVKKTLQKLFILLCGIVVLAGSTGAVFAEPAEEESKTVYLLPNEMVPFTEESEYVQFAAELCAGITDQEEIYNTLLDYLENRFVYDYIKSVTVENYTVPDLDDCWYSKMGIELDLASLMCAMLRSQGVPTMLLVSRDIKIMHPSAWVLAMIGDQIKVCNPAMKFMSIDDSSALTFSEVLASDYDLY